MVKATVESLLSHTTDAYAKNIKLILFFSIPFLIAFPLAAILPTFVASGGIFLRFGSVPGDLGPLELGIVAVAFVISLLLASFALSAINIVVRSQRTLSKLTHYEVQRIEHTTIRLFWILLASAALILTANLFLLNAYANFGGRLIPLQPILGSLVALIVSLAVLFAPQAIAIDDAPISRTVVRSVGILRHRPGFCLFYLVLSSLVILGSSWFFLTYAGSAARIATLVANAVLWVPFLEVFKTQIYLSKYTLI